jgi:GNAT superfamily N-acetyltransferase
MVRAEGLDPTKLYWQNFLIAQSGDQVVGIGQIRRHRTCEELGSLIVIPEFRKRGAAAALITALEARAGRPLYLLCSDDKRRLYERFGYRAIAYRDTPQPLKLKRALGAPFRVFGIRIIAMKKDN